VGNLVLRHSPTFDKAVLALKGQLVTTEELRALKHELRQLSLELNRFKVDLLAERSRELAQIVGKRTRKPLLRVHEMGVSMNRDIN